MEQVETIQSAAPEASESAASVAQPSAAPEAGGSGDQASPSSKAHINAAMNGFMRGALGVPDPTSKPADDAASGGSAPDGSGDVEAGQAAQQSQRGADGRFVPRRGVPEALRQAEQKLAEVDPVKLREQIRAEIEAEQTQKATQQATAAMSEQAQREAEWFEFANRLPDTDPRLSELMPNDPEGRTVYQWREDRKELIAKYPEADAALRADADRRALMADEQRKAAMRDQIEGLARREGVDSKRWRDLGQGLTWEVMASDLLDAREARVRAELKPKLDRLAELERDMQQYRPQALGATREPLGAGRSSSAAPINQNEAMDRWLRFGA